MRNDFAIRYLDRVDSRNLRATVALRPLHTAETEQTLQDNMQDWLAVAAARDTVTMEINYRGINHGAELESLELIAAAAPVYHRIVSSLRALYRGR